MGQQVVAYKQAILFEQQQKGKKPQKIIANFQPNIHQFQSKFIQRIKETPFINSQLYHTSPHICLYIDPIEITLEDLIRPRLNTTKLFPKQEILKIMDCTISGLLELQRKGFEHYGNMAMSNIYYEKSSKMFKLVNPAFCASTNFLLAKEGLKFSFLAPTQILSLIEEQDTEQASFESDMFVLAICLLQICSLRDSQEIYCPDTYNILDIEIQSRLEDVHEYYGEDLTNILKKFLIYESESRITAENAKQEVQRLIIGQNINVRRNSAEQSPLRSDKSLPNIPKSGKKTLAPGTLPRKVNQK